MTYPMTTDFSDYTVCVTGATSGIGKASAEAFLAAGATVIATGRRKDRLAELKAVHGDKLIPIELEVTDRNAVFAALGNLKVDILVNNAGMALGIEPADKASLDDWEAMVDTNIKGVLYVTKALLPGMLDNGRGHIINMGSIAGTYPYPGSNVYGGTKAFLEQFSLNLRAELLGKPIRVSNIEPGLVQTEFSEKRFRGNSEKADALYADTAPLTAQDIAQSVFWCASLPAHMNINRIEIMPVVQASAALTVVRNN